MRSIILFFTSGFYTGYAPVASGTFGTLPGILLFWFLKDLSPVAYLVVLAVLTAIACWLAGEAEKIYGQKDSGRIVIDEMIGYCFTMFALPPVMHPYTTIVLGFFMFRIFDIVKPWPARWIDTHLKGGRGVVLDDVFAGIYANLAMRLVLFLWTKVA